MQAYFDDATLLRLGLEAPFWNDAWRAQHFNSQLAVISAKAVSCGFSALLLSEELLHQV